MVWKGAAGRELCARASVLCDQVMSVKGKSMLIQIMPHLLATLEEDATFLTN